MSKISKIYPKGKTILISCVDVSMEYGEILVPVHASKPQLLDEEQSKNLSKFRNTHTSPRIYLAAETVSGEEVKEIIEGCLVRDKAQRAEVEKQRKKEIEKRAQQEKTRKLKRLAKLSALAAE